MSRLIPMTETLLDYVEQIGSREHPAQVACREDTRKMANAAMQIGPDQGAVMALLARLIGAKRYLEIGTFTGYSALAVALALPDDGRVVCLDISEEYTAKAKQYWRAAGVAEKIDLRLAPARDSLDKMIAGGEAPVDFAFIDADKTGYDAYYERVLRLMRPGGLIALDNMLRGGDVADPAKADEATNAIRALNAKIHGDRRVDMAMAALGDGVMLARKR